MTRVRTSGFTLIELLVVVSIIALLSSLMLASITEARQRARNSRMVAEINSIRTAIETYRNDNNGSFPKGEGNNYYDDRNGTDDLYNALQPIVNEGYIGSLPHPQKFPNNPDVAYGYWPNMDDDIWTCGGSEPNGYVLILYQDPPMLTQYPPLEHPSHGKFETHRCVVYE